MTMSRQEILDRLKQIVVEMDASYASGISEVGEQTQMVRDMGFSSLQMLFMFVMLEERFHIRLQNLTDLKLVCIGDVIDLVERLTQGEDA